MIRADAAARQTTVGIEIKPDLPRVTGDRIHLQQVLLNLLVNGMDAMSTCPVADRRITIRAMRLDPQNVEIAVSDAGVGISPGDRDRIFEPFHTTKQMVWAWAGDLPLDHRSPWRIDFSREQLRSRRNGEVHLARRDGGSVMSAKPTVYLVDDDPLCCAHCRVY